MASRSGSRPAANESRSGTNRAGAGTGIFYVQSASGSVGVYAFDDTAGVTWYFWADTSGNIRRANALPTAPNSDGTVVGP